MKNYNERNRHQRDALLAFDAASHIYTYCGEVFKSVTTLVDECFKQFDAEYWSARKAPSLGMTPAQLRAKWRAVGEEARNLGTQMHCKIERYYLGLPNTTDDTYRLFEQFATQYHLTPYRTEWAIYDEDSHVAGTLDFLDYADGKFIIYDWKRSDKVVSACTGEPIKTNRWGEHAFAPIANIPDTTYWHYALQVSIYRYLLEKNYEINVEESRLAVFHPNCGRPYVINVPYLRDEVIKLLSR